MINLHRILLPVYILILASTALAGDYKVLTNNVPPIKWVEDGMATGVTGDILKRIMADNGIAIDKGDAESMPLAQAYEIARDTPGSIILGLVRIPSREADFKWVGPVYNTGLALIARKDRNIRLSDVKDAAAFKVATVLRSASEKAAFKQGLPQDKVYRLPGTHEAIEQLANGKVDILVFPKSPAFYIMFKSNIDPKQFEVVYEMQTLPVYFAFNKSTSDELIQALQQSLEKLRQPGADGKSEYDAIVGKYFILM